MKARDLIEAESPKSVFKQVSQTPYRFDPRPLTPREIERLADIIAMGPVRKRPSDEKFLRWGYIEYYDPEEPDAVVPRQGFSAALFNHPEIKGAIGPEWLDVPHPWRGRVRRHYEAEDPKAAFRALPRYKESDIMVVNSSHGHFAIDPTGRVVQWFPAMPEDEDAIAMGKIVKFDLGEWKKYWNWQGELPGGFDILDLGFWLRDGMYEGPEEDWRQEIRRAQQDESLGHVAKPEQQTAPFQKR